MTREEAIKIFNTVLCLGKCDCPKDEIEECLKMAIKALEQQPSEEEKVIRIKKGTLKVRTGRYVIHDVEWLKEHFNTTEAKIYGQPKVEGARGDIPLQQSVPKMPQPKKEDTSDRKIGFWIEHNSALGISYIECPECSCWFLKRDLPHNSYCPNCGSRNHWEYELKWMEVKKEHFNTTEAKIYGQPNEDCISRKAVLDGLASIAKARAKSDIQKSLMGRVMFFTEHLPSVTPQPSEHTEERTEMHECDLERIIKSTIKEYLDKDCDDVTELLLALSKDLCERIRKESENGEIK